MWFAASRDSLSRSACQLERKTVGVSLGNFDGMHLGHQKLFDTLRTALSKLAGPEQILPTLFTFAPHPRLVLGKVSQQARTSDPEFWPITPLRQKLTLAEDYGIELFYLQKFTKSFSSLGPKEFIERYLVEPLQPRIIVVGTDWSFGKGREGNAELLSEYGSRYGFEVIVVPDVIYEGLRISSSRIRQVLTAGDLDETQALLGRPFEIMGRVHPGSKRGRSIGFRTANLHPDRQLLLPKGVYATRTTLNGVQIPSISNLGVRPTFGPSQVLLETHLLDGERADFYGALVRVSFVKKIRDEMSFSSLERLKAQITTDVAKAQDILERT